MPFSDMLFSTTHSVEQLVDIKKKKQVDKVLLKVIRTIRSKGNLDGWVKPEANLRTDLKLSDKTIASILKSLSDYYNVDLTKNKSLLSAKAIVSYIKANRANLKDSIFLINASDVEMDENNEVDADGAEQEETPYIHDPAETHVSVVPQDPEHVPSEDNPAKDPVIGENPSENTLAPTEEVEKSDDTGEEPGITETPESTEISVSTESLDIKQSKKSSSFSDMLNSL